MTDGLQAAEASAVMGPSGPVIMDGGWEFALSSLLGMLPFLLFLLSIVILVFAIIQKLRGRDVRRITFLLWAFCVVMLGDGIFICLWSLSKAFCQCVATDASIDYHFTFVAMNFSHNCHSLALHVAMTTIVAVCTLLVSIPRKQKPPPEQTG